jgi:MerR family transcriptional regulator, light-induced transcriptional regulator
MSEELSLQDAADILDVHYMTAYRYVRLGLLNATKVGGTWRVKRSDLDAFRDGSSKDHSLEGESRKKSAPWSERLELRLLAGDARGAWGVVEAALAAGADLDDIYIEVVSPALVSIGEKWARGDLEIYLEHRASAIVGRIMGRLGPRFARRGRTRGAVLVGAPEGERHSLPVSMVADLIRQSGWEVYDLGADLPADSFAVAARNTIDLAAVCISVTSEGSLSKAVDAITEVRNVVHPSVQIYVGGLAVKSAEQAETLGADGWAANAGELVAVLNELPSRTPIDNTDEYFNDTRSVG